MVSSYHTTPSLDPEEMLLAAMVRQAIRDATQSKQEHVRYEAARWLWTVSPAVAERAGVPLKVTERI